MTDEHDERGGEPQTPAEGAQAPAGDAKGQEAPAPPAADAPAGTPSPSEGERVRPTRQWVTLYRSSLDLRVGEQLLEKTGRDLRSLAGKPRAAALLCGPSCPGEIAEELRRRLVEVGFDVREAPLAEGPGALDVEQALRAMRSLADLGLTGDDVAVAVGDASALSVASMAAGSWCGGITLAMVPTDLAAALLCGVTPRALDVDGHAGVVSRPSAARILYADLAALGDLAANSEANLLSRALMVAGAVVDGEKSFSHLWDRAEDVRSGSRREVCAQLAESVKTRGRTVSSTSIATRQSLAYGEVAARALKALCPAAPESTCLAEALRLTARLGVACSGFAADDMLAQDDLLWMLGLPELEVGFGPEELVGALRDECFRRSNKFMLLVPQALGRVRFWAVDEDVLTEHARAWCAAHAPEGAGED